MRYRPEIDGLRAFAVLPVLFFHAGAPGFSGGYVGVDVFFVISGYLITSIVVDDVAAAAFSLGRFYERRARRILPALFVVLVASCVPAWFLMTPLELREFGQSLVAVVSFSANVLFWFKSGYFDTDAAEKPLLHTWSLAVEEQFYLVFPLLLILLLRRAPRARVTALLSIAIVSVVVSEFLLRRGHADANYYLMPSRAWELMVGALLAVSSQRPMSRAWREFGSAVGVALIAFAVYAYNADTPFPGLYAVPPVLGAALVVRCASETSTGRWLSAAPIVGIGLISYSLYLWHVPLFAFTRIAIGHQPSAAVSGLLLIATVALSFVTYRYVERPMRDRSRVSSRTVFRFAAVASGAMIAVGLAGHVARGFPARFDLPESVAESFAQSPRLDECFDIAHGETTLSWYCLIDHAGATPSYFVIGDSHAFSLLPAFEQATAATGRNGAFAAFAGCPPLLGVYPLGRKDATLRDCHALNDRVIDWVRANGVRDVFLVARWTYYTDGNYVGGNTAPIGSTPGDPQDMARSRDVFAAAVERTVDAYRGINVRLHIVEQVPLQLSDPRDTYYRGLFKNGATVESLSVRFAEHERLQRFVASVFGAYHDLLIPTAARFCGATYCRIGTETESYYFDDSHLSVAGATVLAEDLSQALSR